MEIFSNFVLENYILLIGIWQLRVSWNFQETTKTNLLYRSSMGQTIA